MILSVYEMLKSLCPKPVKSGHLLKLAVDLTRLESEMARIVADYERLKGKDTGRPIHAGKEVPHD